MKQKGFTLIEIMVVILIIGLLATVIIMRLNYAKERARDTQRMADLTIVASALDMYYGDNQSTGYPNVSTATLINTTLITPNRYLERNITNPYPTANFNANQYYYSFIDANSYRLYFDPERDEIATCGSGCSGHGNIYLIKNGKVANNW